MLNYSSYRAWTSSITFSPASNKFVQVEKDCFVKIWISSVIRLGQKERNILLRAPSDSLINRILMQNKIRISRAGDGFSDFMTSLSDSSTILSLFSYLSTLPAYITKHTLSKFLILSRVDSALRVKISKSPYLDNNSPSRSLLSV